VHELDPLLELLVAGHERCLRDAERGLLVERLDHERVGQLGRLADLLADRKHREARHADAVIGEQLLGQALVARQHQSARVAAGVALAQQLEVADDVLVVDRDLLEVDEQIEGDVRLELGERPLDRAEVVADAQLERLVAELLEPLDHVELGAEVGDLFARYAAQAVGRHQLLVHEHEDSTFLPHRASR
jgi:hypothetical protein